MRRPMIALGVTTLFWSLACSGMADQAKGLVATQVARAIAESLDVPPDQVSVEPLDNGRWTLDTPEWDANCGFGPDSIKPKGFGLAIDSGLMADCVVEGSCTEVLGMPCDKTGEKPIGIALAVAEGKNASQAVAGRTKEMEGKGWTVSSKKDPDNKKAIILSGMRGKRVQAVAIVSESDGGSVAEILVSPIRKARR